MLRLFIIVVLIVAAGFGAVYLANLPGSISFDLFGWQGRLPVLAAILVQLVIGGLLALIWGLFAGLWKLPGRIGQSRKRSRVRKANHALADGLLAAEAGDAKTAERLARKADAHADDDRLKVLLEARTAETAGDWVTAERSWAQLARLPGGQLAGLRGTATAAMARGSKRGGGKRTRSSRAEVGR